jgi:hypothetical protein
VTSESDPKPKTDERKAMAAWAASVHRGLGELYRDLASREQPGVPPLAEHERLATDIARWFADLFIDGREIGRDDQAIIRRISEAFRPVDKTAKVRLANALIEEHAKRYLEALPHYRPLPTPKRPLPAPKGNRVVELGSVTPGYEGNAPPLIAEQLIVALSNLVHEGFAAALDNADHEAIGALLERWYPDKGRRTEAPQGGGKLAAAGILAQLNTLADEPLGPQSVSSICNKLKIT